MGAELDFIVTYNSLQKGTRSTRRARVLALRRMTTRRNQLNLVAQCNRRSSLLHQSVLGRLGGSHVSRMSPSVGKRIRRLELIAPRKELCDMETLGLAAYLTLVCWCAWLIS
jgi:hypothetical protein